MSFVYPEDHLHAIAERDAAVDAAMKAANELHEITRDRDEWKEQHENLLAMYQAQTVEQSPQAPIAKLTIGEDGMVQRAGLYAPGLPPGEHDVYLDPSAPGLRDQPGAGQ